ncbi:MAG: D-cysteine desulfhydrase family protein [Candidatus Eisenbacteria bacterium]|uniref:D-cysteine desulfhydrase family protein n=1 Tax=Eiseniibacteriota bacterium TaxID=2212470 RepID=A0A7Y2E8Q9_UNCEI|nr:D-cysteine desulfhydrase family protein [Candidatus Eisenbacteria bacterium]
MRIQLPPHFQLGFFPTPLHGAPRFSEALGGPEVLLKRDDQTGLALGGNKTRKLEFLVADALERESDVLLTAGAAQSNHCRQTAAAARMAGLECHLALGGEAPEKAQGNLLLDQLLGATLHWCGTHRKGETLPEIEAQLRAQGKKPYVVPYGGSNELGALGFAVAIRELAKDLKDWEPRRTHVVFASSSGGTHAGLEVGTRLLGHEFNCIGISIDKEEDAHGPFEERIAALAGKTAALIGPEETWRAEDITLRKEFQGEGYGVIGEPEKEAMELLAQTEGVLLDPVYTARAVGGCIAMIREGEFSSEDRVVFWHTGGAPAIFSYAESLS